MFFLNYIVLAVFLNTVNAAILYKNRVCEGNTMDITCPKGFGLDIIIGVFGTRNNESCNDRKNILNECTSGDRAFLTIKFACNQKLQCRLHATNEVFSNNTCKGPGKELKVVYRCLSHVDIVKAVACENEKMSLECTPGFILRIIDAFYGRKNQLTCHETHRSTEKCLNIEVMEPILNRCEGVQRCIIFGNEDFADPKLLQYPCKNSSKYLEVDYRCESEIMRQMVCENELVMLSCSRGFALKILTVFYGKGDKKFCNLYTDNLSRNCEGLPSAVDIVHFHCAGKSICYVPANGSLFPEHCPTTFKYLEVTYECVKVDILTKVACDNDTIYLQCQENFYVWIVKAYYGRSNPYICNTINTTSPVKNCECDLATDVIKSRCNNLKECLTFVSNDMFNCTCSKNVTKYLEVDYRCLDQTESFLEMPNNCFNGRRMASVMSEKLDNFIWSKTKTEALVHLWKKYRPMVGSRVIKTMEVLWEVISEDLSKKFTTVAAATCEKKWCELEASYKTYLDDVNVPDCNREIDMDAVEFMENSFSNKQSNKSITEHIAHSGGCCQKKRNQQLKEREEFKLQSAQEKVTKAKEKYQNRKMETRKEKVLLYREKNLLIKSYIDFIQGKGCCVTTCKSGDDLSIDSNSLEYTDTIRKKTTALGIYNIIIAFTTFIAYVHESLEIY